jgi:DNA-binding winged helix-turn-helix (wHTH) protein/Tfp pilus assembly protein PilF
MTATLPSYAFGSFVLDPAARRLTCQGRRVSVPGKAWQILMMLAEAGGRLIPRETLRATLWPNVVVEERTLIVHMSTLRKVLAADRSTDYIETVTGAGYRLAVPVRVVASAEPPASSTPSPARSLAVRPFSMGDPGEADRYLGVGMADALAEALSRVPGLIAYPVGALEALTEGQDGITAGRALGLGHVLDGAVRLQDDRIHVSARLIDVASGLTQWSERFEQPRANAATLQGAIAQRVADSLAHLSAAERDGLQSYRPRSTEAFFLQMRGRAHLRPFMRLPVLQALTLFEQALALDPDYAMAHAGLASTYLLLASTAMLRPLPVDEAMPLARRAAERALALDEGLAEAWAALGRVKMEYDWDWDGAEADLAHAVALNSSSVEALATFGQLLSALGRHDDAIQHMEEARRLDPRNVETLQHLGVVYWMAGEAERALAAVRDSLAIVDSPRAHYGRMMILDEMGRRDEAMAERLATLRGLDLAVVAEQVDALNRSQGWRAAMELWIGLLERTNRWEGAAIQWMAVDEPARALDALEHCLKARTTYLFSAGQTPSFRRLHGDPHFQRILRSLDLVGRIGTGQRAA